MLPSVWREVILKLVQEEILCFIVINVGYTKNYPLYL